MAIQATIVDGPSKFDLMIGLFHGDSHKRCPVSFTAQDPNGTSYRAEVTINSLQREDGSGENWNFEGWCVNGNVVGHYNTQRRKGHLKKKDS